MQEGLYKNLKGIADFFGICEAAQPLFELGEVGQLSEQSELDQSSRVGMSRTHLTASGSFHAAGTYVEGDMAADEPCSPHTEPVYFQALPLPREA
jgi:hypothetical protein